MSFTVQQIADAIQAKAEGATDLVVTSVAEPRAATADQIALAFMPAYADDLAKTDAHCAIVWADADWQEMGLRAAIRVPRGRVAMAGLTQLFDHPLPATGVSDHALVDHNATLGNNVSVGAFSVIATGAVIGDDCWIGDQVSIGHDVIIGAGSVIYPGVRIQRGSNIGQRAILQPNVVIGGDGFSFVSQAPSNVEKARETLGAETVLDAADPAWHRIHSLGGVTIGDDVEVGASATIDAGTIRPTQVGNGTKIDSQVQVGHNVIIGEYCLLCAQSGVAGSTMIGDRVVIGGMAGVADNLKVGDDVVLAGGSVVLSNVPSGRVMMGYPATTMKTHVESYKALRRLPRLLSKLRGS